MTQSPKLIEEPQVARVSVVVVSYHSGPVLFTCIEAILRQSLPIELIIVDNGNPADDLTRLAQLNTEHANIQLITGHGNAGFSAGCNLGAKQASAPYLALINPDCIIGPEWLATALKIIPEDAAEWIIGADLRNPDGTAQRGSRRDFLTPWRMAVEALRLYKLAPRHPYFKRLNQHQEPTPGELVEIPVISGACMLMPKSVYDARNGMDEDYFLHVEDLDFCLRHHLAGGKTFYSSELRATHYKSSSRANWFFVEFNKSKSLCIYFRKHFDGIYPPGLLRLMEVVVYCRFLAQSFTKLLSLPFTRRLHIRETGSEMT